MRRIWIAIGICALLGGLCTWSLFYSQCESRPLLDKLEEADALAQEGNIEQLKEITEEIGELWDRWSWNANTFIRHEDLEPVESAISSMEGALRSGTIEHYRISCYQAAEWFRHAIRTELPTLANIF